MGKLRGKAAIVRWSLAMAWRIDRRLLAATFAVVAALAVLPAVSLAFNREAIARLSSFLATGAGTFDELVPVLVAYGALLAVIALSGRLSTDYLASLTENAYGYGMQEHLMDTVHRIDLMTLMARNVNEDFNYIIRQSRALNKLVCAVCAIMGKALSIGSLCVMALTLSPPVLALALAYVAATVALCARFKEGTRFSFPVFRKAEVKALFLQSMPLEPNIAKEIRVFGCAEPAIASWRAAYGERMALALRRVRAQETRGFALGAVFYLFLAAVLGYLLALLADGGTTPAVFLTTLTLCTSLFAALGTLARDLLAFDESLFSMEQQAALLAQADADDGTRPDAPGVAADAPGERPDPSPADPDAVLSARGLSFSYATGAEALRCIDLDVRRGEVVALVGANGSGKTTLVKVLCGVLAPTQGTLLFEGRPLAAWSPDEVSRRVGLFFQDFYLFHHSLGENIAYGDADLIDDEGAIARAVGRGGAEGVVARCGRGLGTLAGKRIDKEGVELSGGQRQLVGTARAYMGDKDLLVFDEPASMLDPLAEMDQFRAIRERLGGSTGILVSHRVGFARLADRIVMMEGGRIAEQGTHDELMARDGLYARFFREQACWYDQDGAGEGGPR